MSAKSLNAAKAAFLEHAIMCADSLKKLAQKRYNTIGPGEQAPLTAAEQNELKDFMLIMHAEFASEQSTIQQEIKNKIREMS